ncbi:MAG: tRNA preQ1(34) S-adenosylmethionine ribosyltransferase-isomerase QueA [Opitutales bacterium]|jgi:S-adenosylmethionine:tRNA ribosyltransferase-isomerase|nr:tRNA preQ1(34) S-adenosylmethionine ribosyltransferase-isomerase QueA [Opitutales bacterium]MDP4643613.1 tRNA preQ1(34) S-adenosylmethionine ribosyltransferase-isomerase QueA [Opitutales bacterium]MDP4778305.1 tRNA preQ1(34) S-adenosylmethionine ribosyltransferase-isomerase QueA [Opitutales bacterium]MDP5080571.1 tRNA preQ1(34) S-adenosylmethionine ribosyltransferase-isomerase QueA [Opitutales bacterium]
MDSALFDYHLPAECIAQEPAVTRDASRLMVVNRADRTVTHTHFAAIGEHLPSNARLFRNNAAVLKARIFGTRPTGGKVECLLLQPAEDAVTWWCLLKPGKKTFQGGQFGVEGEYTAEVLEAGSNGNYRVRFHPVRDESVTDLSERLGIMPLPPYIERIANDPRQTDDNERYQTVYADYDKRVAVAAPTAGLHFTPELIDELTASGATFHDLTLQVGIGTFHPIQVDQIEAHNIHREWYEIPTDAYRTLQNPEPGPRIAVGTTSVRSIEDAMRRTQNAPETCLTPSGSVQAEADIFIFPPAQFAAVDGLITNFHLPKSTLLCLVSAFLTPGSEDGIPWLMELYAEAIAHKYRFYSYGDAMLIL